LLDVDRPVVITGAMRGPEALGADGPAKADSIVGSRLPPVTSLQVRHVSYDEVAFSDDFCEHASRVTARVTVFEDVGEGHVVFVVSDGAPTSA
jgi:hypothetical protein